MVSRELRRLVLEAARELGFDAAGIARVSPVPPERLEKWFEKGFQGKMAYLERNLERRLDPTLVLPGARSILTVRADYYHPAELPYDDPTRGVVSRYAQGADYHRLISGRLESLILKLRDLVPEIEARTYVDTGPVLEKYWAEQAGIGWIGKHTNLINRHGGSWFFLGELLLNLEVEPDIPARNFCGTCTRCIDACPTGAIVEPYLLDARRCISYLTIELREEIPCELRPGMRNLIFGCDICQDVCPWNRKPSRSSGTEFLPDPQQHFDLKSLARLTPGDFDCVFRESPIRRAKWRGLMRNVAVALGNSRAEGFVRELELLLRSGDELVSCHAAWALRRIGTPEALGQWGREKHDSGPPDRSGSC